MDIQRRVDRLRGRFESLADGAEASVPGSYELAAGLAKMMAHLKVDDIENRQRLAVIIEGLSGLADFLEHGADSEFESPDAASDSDEQLDEELDQFVATFRKDAGKRIQGLSISLMGIFGEGDHGEALDQSVDHLHAIRGAAAMLGFDDIAELAAKMENLLATRAKVDAPDWQWPTKLLLRGYAFLQQAVEATPPGLPEEAGEVVAGLKQSAGELSSQSEASTEESGDVSRETQPQTPVAAPQPDRERSSDGDPDTDADLQQPILVVDDVETIAASVGFILAELEVPVEVASDGKEAIQMLNQKPFSLVVSDIDMPRMDGISLVEMIRSDPQLSELPVILLTSLDHEDERRRGMEAGATDYIIKGAIGGGELVRRVRELLQVAPVVQRSEPARKRKILVAEDTETVAASIAFVLSEGPFEIVLATDGKDAFQRLERESFDLLITDLQMPYVTGTELVEKLRDHRELSELPVIMLTSVENEQKRAAAIDAGVDRYMIKGEIAGGRLLEEVEQLLE